MSEVASNHSLKRAYSFETDTPTYTRLLFYCETCTHWYQSGKHHLGGESLIGEKHTVRARCLLQNNHHPERCNGIHDLLIVGESTPELQKWRREGEPDWPKAPEDFLMGDEQ